MGVKKYNPEIDLMKFLFSLAVVFYHSNKLVAAAGIPFFPFGFTATDFFFMISGYLKVKSSKKFDSSHTGKSTFDFVMGKIKSLYPYLLFAFVVAFGVRQFAKYISGSFTTIKFFKDSILAINEVLILQNSGINFGSIYNGPTWYISAMLIAMAVLFPILLKHKDWFVNIGSLVIAIFCYAYSEQEKGTLNTVGWNGFTSMGIIRAVAGICLGVFLCSLVEKYQQSGIVLKRKGKVLVWFAEIAMLLLLVVIMQKEGQNSFDYISVILIFFICFIILSQITGFAGLLPEKLCGFLGKSSLVIYLNHRCVIFFMNAVYPDLDYAKTMIVYFAASAVMALIAELVVTICKKIWKKAKPCVLKAFTE